MTKFAGWLRFLERPNMYCRYRLVIMRCRAKIRMNGPSDLRKNWRKLDERLRQAPLCLFGKNQVMSENE